MFGDKDKIHGYALAQILLLYDVTHSHELTRGILFLLQILGAWVTNSILIDCKETVALR